MPNDNQSPLLSWPCICKAALRSAMETRDFELAEQLAVVLIAMDPHDWGDSMNSPIAIAASRGLSKALLALFNAGFFSEPFVNAAEAITSSLEHPGAPCFELACQLAKQTLHTPDEFSTGMYHALTQAAGSGNLKILLTLIEMGAPVDPQHSQHSQQPRFTPFALACEHNHTDCMDALVGAGANINADTGNGWTPIARAIKDGRDQTSLALIVMGADLFPKDGIPKDSTKKFGNALLYWADTRSKTDGGDRVLAALHDAGVPLDLTMPGSAAYKALALSDWEATVLRSNTSPSKSNPKRPL